MAKAASERRRLGWDQLISSWAAVTGPTPGWASSAGAIAWTSGPQLLAELPGLLVSGQGALGGQPQRPHRGPVLDRVGGCGDQGRARPGLPKPGPPGELGPQRLGGGDQQRLEVPAGISADLDRPRAGQVQHPKGLPLATLAWAGQMVAAQGLPAGSDGVQQVALGAGPAAGPLGPVDLDHPLTLGGQEAGQAGAIAAGASNAQQRRLGARSVTTLSRASAPAWSLGISSWATSPPLGSRMAAVWRSR